MKLPDIKRLLDLEGEAVKLCEKLGEPWDYSTVIAKIIELAPDLGPGTARVTADLEEYYYIQNNPPEGIEEDE
jgi:hypothetical protein